VNNKKSKSITFINAQYIFLRLCESSADSNAVSDHYNELHTISLFCFFIKYLAQTYWRNYELCVKVQHAYLYFYT